MREGTSIISIIISERAERQDEHSRRFSCCHCWAQSLWSWLIPGLEQNRVNHCCCEGRHAVGSSSPPSLGLANRWSGEG